VLDALVEGAQTAPEVTHDTDDASYAREKAISFARLARTLEDHDASVSGAQGADQDEQVGAAGLEPTTSAV
jgi:hypothetical protein